MDITVLNRLIAARHLIESSGPPLTPSSPPLVLAQKLLVAHDAAELIFFALISFAQMSVKSEGGQVIKDPSFRQLADTVLSKAALQPNFALGSKLKLFEDLLEARKVFKHRGILVDCISNHNLFSDVIRCLDELCNVVVQQSIFKVDQSAAILLQEARQYFVLSNAAIAGGDFRVSLEQTARALSACFWHSNTPGYLVAGQALPEEALLLSGRGIDPASYLAMQQFLPRCWIYSEQPEWDLRKYGHDGNWTEVNALFCLQTAIDIVVKLQTAAYKPTAENFYDFFEDVVEILQPTQVLCVRGHYFSLGISQESIGSYQVGEKIYGKATGRHEKATHLTADGECPFEYADWIAIEHPRSERLNVEKDSTTQIVLWIKRVDVKIGHRANKAKSKIRANRNRIIEDISQSRNG